jgi:hypothetical protein
MLALTCFDDGARIARGGVEFVIKVTMPASPSESATVLQRFAPAWLFSLAFHVCMIVVLGLAVQQSPRAASNKSARSAGIVLSRTTAELDSYEGGQQQSDQPTAAIYIAAPELLSSLPSKPVGTNRADEVPKPPLPDLGATRGGAQPEADRLAPGSGQRGSLGGDHARLRVFGVEGTGSKFVYVFDRSSSMEGPPLSAAKRQLIESLRSLDSAHQFHIIFFNTRSQSLGIAAGARRIALATDRNKQLAANFVGGITADGGTDRFAALREAIGLAPDVIFFLTDADDPMPASELAEIARANLRSRAAICVIEFGRRPTPPGSNFLTELARQSGGQYGYVNVAALSR